MYRKALLLFLLSFVISGLTQTALADDGKGPFRVLISPFDVTGAGQYKYLQDSIQTMVASRLANRDRVVIVDRKIGKKELAALQQTSSDGKTQLHEILDVDFLLSGNLFALAGGLNIQIALYPVKAEEKVHEYSIVVKNPENLITEIEQLVAEIGNENFTTQQKPTLAAGEGGPAETRSGFVTAHPEAAYKRRELSGTIMSNAAGLVNVETVGAKKSFNLNENVKTIAVTDADGDQVVDIFALVDGAVLVLHETKTSVEKVGEYKLPGDMNCHALNLADLDGDGKAEIYLSATDGLQVSSSILSWDRQRGFTVRQSHIPYYIRPVNIPGSGMQLFGQERGVEKGDFVRDGVYRLRVDPGKGVEKGERLALPERINLFDFVYADLDGDKTSEIVVIDQQEKLRVYSSANELLWVAKKHYGGSKISIGPKLAEARKTSGVNNLSYDEEAERDVIFVPGRLVVTDVNHDGRAEIAVTENIRGGWGYFKRLRYYKEGSLVALAWTGNELQTQWQTGLFKGFVADFALQLSGGLDTADEKGKITETGGMYIVHQSVGDYLLSMLPGLEETEFAVYQLAFYTPKTE
jgi:TolB-like protein